MVILILKLVLFFVLTSIPFLYHFLIKPRRESIKRYRNAFTAVQPQMSKLKKAIWRVGTYLINFYDKMKRREKPRKFFTLLLLLSLLLFQGVDNFASSEVAATYKTMVKENRLNELSISGKKTVAPFMQRKFSNYLYPFLTRPIVYLVSFALTLIFFSYRMANWILTIIHNSKKTLLVLSAIMSSFLSSMKDDTCFFQRYFSLLQWQLYSILISMIAYLRKVGNLSLFIIGKTGWLHERFSPRFLYKNVGEIVQDFYI